eukprot:jgi/Mesen1/10342/ME000008S10122
MVSNAVEALIGAIYAHQGIKVACDFVAAKILPSLLSGSLLEPERKQSNPMSALQERALKRFKSLPVYKVVGVDYEKTPHQQVRVRVYVETHRLSTGMGPSITEAKRDAALKALERWPLAFKAQSSAPEA